VTELAETLSIAKGTVAHHLKVLEDAGLVKVVRTRKVRAMTERYWGRSALLFRIVTDDSQPPLASLFLRSAADEVAADAGTGDDPSSLVLAHARVPAARAREFALRLEELGREFESLEEPDERVFGFVAAVYATDFRTLPKQKGRKRG